MWRQIIASLTSAASLDVELERLYTSFKWLNPYPEVIEIAIFRRRNVKSSFFAAHWCIQTDNWIVTANLLQEGVEEGMSCKVKS